MKRRIRPPLVLCGIGGLLLGPAALAQQDPRAVIVRPSTAKAGSARSPRAQVAKRYWADYAGKAIMRSNVDGSNPEVLVSETEGPYGVSHDPETDSILWTSAEEQLVQMAPASGSGPTVTLNSSFAENFAIVVNGSERNTAYGVEGTQLIRVTEDRNTGAKQRAVLLTLSSSTEVHGLALTPDNGALYLGDSTGRMTRKLNLTTLQVTQLVYDDGTSSTTASKPAPSSTEKTR